ncbi:hypothetical protein BKA93DRAFT_830556 [Sparassis latifolia]
MLSTNSDETLKHLRDASIGFDHLFSNDLEKAREIFATGSSPFHALGLGVCAFLEAALGMETGLLVEAARCLALSEAGSKKQFKSSKGSGSNTQFPPGIEWELLHSDAIILLGLNHALSAHSKYSRLYKAVYPAGLYEYTTPGSSPSPSVYSSASSTSVSTFTGSTPNTPKSPAKSTFFGRWGKSSLSVPSTASVVIAEEGSVDELILSGTAFGFGLFNLVFSLLPAKIRGVVGFLGFNHDRKLALQALAVSARRTDAHSVFAGLALMTYHGVVLLLAGYQADEAHIIKQYRAIVENIASRYPNGSLWILNRAKILRMTYDPEGAIAILQEGLQPNRPHTFSQADGLLIFELAWTLLSQRRYKEAAEMFIRMTKVNSWSHGTYYFIAAGCYVSLKDYDKAQELLDEIPVLLEKKKITGKDLPTEVFIKKKLAFYREKQKRWTGSEEHFARCIRVSPAEELGIFWNTHARILKETAEAHIAELAVLVPHPTITSPYVTAPTSPPATAACVDIDTPDEFAIRSLLLGITHRTAGAYEPARAFLSDAYSRQSSIKVSTWVGGVTLFELAVLELKETEARTERDTVTEMMTEEESRKEWARALKVASEHLEAALALATQQVDLSSRLDSRIAMLKDEIGLKREMLFAA